MPPDTPTTQDFEYLLVEKANVIGVNYAPDRDHLDVWVSQQLPSSQLAPDDNVSDRSNLPEWFDGDVDVHDAGYGDEKDGFDPAVADPDGDHAGPEQASPGRRSRVRPVESGVSEIAGRGAATGGVLARVTRPDAGRWSTRVSAGDLVRVSNAHVYVHPLNAPLDTIPVVYQPSKLDGGTHADVVGHTAGYVPLADGVHVDAAARTIDITRESTRHFGLSEQGLGTGVRREDYASLVGEQVVKGGRTTGETTGTIRGADATIHVGYGGEMGVVRLRHQLVASDMSKGGDSGSPVFHAASGALVGHLFAGSDRATIINQARRIEDALGVELMPENTTSVDADVQVTMKSPHLSHKGTTPETEPVGPGESVRLRSTFVSNYDETVWVTVSGPEGSSSVEVTPSEAPGATQTDDGEWQFMVGTEVTAPAAYSPAFTVALEAGHRLG